MTQTANLNLITGSPELPDLLDMWKKQLKLEFNCHHIGTIQSFESTTQSAQATINYRKSYLQLNEIGDTYYTNPNYPVLVSCPCIVLGGGGGYLSFPIAAGDECIILFNDRDIDNWFAGSSSSPPLTGRLHAFTDAICLVGLRSLPNVIIDYQDSSVVVQYQGNTIQVLDNSVLVNLAPSTIPFVSGVSLELTDAGKLSISNETGEFVAALSQLFSDIQAATTNTIFGPQPLIMPTFTTDLAVFNSFME